MSPRQANIRYMRLMMGGSAGYVISVLAVTWLTRPLEGVSIVNVGLGLIPGIFLLIMLYSIWRYLKEVDEAQRFFLTRGLVIASFAVLAVSGVWGLLEMIIDGLPRIPVFWLFPTFFLVFGLQAAIGPNRDTHCA